MPLGERIASRGEECRRGASFRFSDGDFPFVCPPGIRRFIVFHGKVHPSTLGAAEVSAFVEWLAVRQKVSASIQNQALSAIIRGAIDTQHSAVQHVRIDHGRAQL